MMWKAWSVVVLGVACATPSWPPAAVDGVSAVPPGLDRHRPVPESNTLTPSTIGLGRALFFDSLLSDDGTRACATCHDPRRGFTDGRQVSVGVHGRLGRRNVPTLVNRAYGRSFFWDGRVTTLEEQVLEPIINPLEMGMTPAQLIERLHADATYRDRFTVVFGRDPTAEDVGRALASFVRTILSGDTPFDRYVRGDGAELASAVQRGLDVFRRKGCVTCHVGPNFSDEQFHNTGVAWRNGGLADSGRYLISGNVSDLGAFKTPTLREVSRTAPYMHDGSLATLDDVLEFYDQGGRANPHRDPLMHPLALADNERAALRAFLESLGRSARGAAGMSDTLR